MEGGEFRPFVVDEVADSLGADVVVAEPQRLEVVPGVLDEIGHIIIGQIAFACIVDGLLSDRTLR